MFRPRLRAPAFARHLATIFALFLIGCSSGAGCSSCGGIEPLAGGFEPAKKIENAGSARLTESGVQFLQDNLGTLAGKLFGASNGVLSFPINTSSGTLIGTDYTICPDGPNATDCNLQIDFAHSNLVIAITPTHEIKITGPLSLHLNLPVHALGCDLTVSLDDGGDCPTTAAFASIQLTVDISIESDQNQAHSRFGYTRIHVATIDVDAGQLSDNIGSCADTFLCSLESAFIDAIKGFAIDLLHDTVDNLLQSQIDQQLCQKSNPDLSPSCPTGSNDVSGICRYGSDANAECVSMMLGTDGHANLGGLLASLSPGTQGGLDFLFAAGGDHKSTANPDLFWGDLEPTDPDGNGKNGGTIGLYGGAEPNPVSKCVKFSDLALPAGIPIPADLFKDTVSGWPADLPGPHVGIALSERFTNYALSSAYNSGLLCLGISTESIALLNSSTIGLLVKSSKQLAIQQEAQQIGIVVRPSSPPTITFGNGTNLTTDPLLRVKLNQASFDFYIYSLDRFIRFMTATYDLDVPLNLTVGPKGLTPTLDKIGVKNGKVTNSALLAEDPKLLAENIGMLIESEVGQALGGGIAPIDLSAALGSFGLALVIPDTVKDHGSPGLRKLTDSGDNFLGIFASLELAQPASLTRPLPARTSLEVIRKDVDKKGLTLQTMNDKNGPVVRVRFGSPAEEQRNLEYSYRLDKGYWHPYTTERTVDIDDAYLRLQGKHVVAVRARVVGQPSTEDPNPALATVNIDVEPPTVKVGDVGDDGKVTLTVKDAVSDLDHQLVRVRLDDKEWSSWQSAREVTSLAVGAAKAIEVEAKDEEGNVGTSRQALLRGRSTATAAGCGCVVAGGDDGPRGAGWLVAVALGGVAARFARARALFKRAPLSGARAKKARAAVLRGVGAVAALGIAFSWAGCSCGDDTSDASSGGPEECKSPDCITLKPGLIGAYTSVAVTGSTIWAAGYSEANWDQGYSFGDLVVGKWNGKKVVWDSVDGVPSDPKVDGKKYNTSGYRGGQVEAGDDVGIWTSIALDDSGVPAVAYYDRTNKALKFAQLHGKSWSVDTVDSKADSDVGRYAKLLFHNGAWVVAYQSIEPGGEGGAALSRVRLATSTSAKPTDTEWTIEDVAVDKQSPCRAQYCSGKTVCVASSKRCVAPGSGCTPSCSSGTACIGSGSSASCQAVFDNNKLDAYPDAIGGYISIAAVPQAGVGVAYYDRPRGNLMVAVKDGNAWRTALVDGDKGGTDTGDTGVGTSLFIDNSGLWHISYVDGITEALKYVKVNAQLKVVGDPEIVDDGQVLNGVQNADGQHLVGDDSSLFVTDAGEAHVSYQDATSGKLRYAVGVPNGDKHKWTVQAIEQDGFAGAFSHVIQRDSGFSIVNWWRTGGAIAVGDVAIVTP